MSSMIITKAGLDLLGSAYARGESNYWIGYYGLAFVPDKSSDPVKPEMTRLTETGDYIYNIWQGDLINGYATDGDPENAASSLFGLTLYSKGICSNYRYVLDADGNNNLVSWTSSGSSAGENTFNRTPFHIYRGNRYEVDDTTNDTSNVKSEIPVPAPLFYMNEPDKDNYRKPLDPDSFGTSLCTKTGASGYPPYPLNTTCTKYDRVPMVSSDARFYVGDGVAPTNTTTFEENCDNDAYVWMNSTDTRPVDAIDDKDKFYNRQYWKMRSVSNFNRFHGTVSSEGYGVSSVSSCHNMSRATKLFPISYYTVINDNGKTRAETEINDADANEELASAIKFTIDLSLIAKDDNFSFADYDNENLPDEDIIVDENGTNLYATKYNSFKFNRIGIYAVPMTIHRYAQESGGTSCDTQHVQFEIDGDAEPILFAVADIDIFKISDNDGTNGLNKFTLDFILNMEGASSDSAVIRDTAIFYNMYENSAITWYENQLLASAGLSEAVTNLQIELNYLKSQMKESGNGSCCSQDLDLSKYALKNHTHDYLKNLVDGISSTGALRGINTVAEGPDNKVLSLNGLSDKAPSSTWWSYENTDLALYVYSVGYLNYNNAYTSGSTLDTSEAKFTETESITTADLDTLLGKLGIEVFIRDVMRGNLGYQRKNGSNIDVIDSDHVYVWIASSKIAIINKTSGTYSVISGTASDLNAYYPWLRKRNAILIDTLSGDYFVGDNTIVLGEDTMGAGANQLVQGKRAYADKMSHFGVLTGLNSMIVNSPYTTLFNGNSSVIRNSESVLGAGNYSTISNAHNSIVNARSSNLDCTSIESSIINATTVDTAAGISNSIIESGYAKFNGIYRSLVLIGHNTSNRPEFNGVIEDSMVLGSVGGDIDHPIRRSMLLKPILSELEDWEVNALTLFNSTVPTDCDICETFSLSDNEMWGTVYRTSVTGDGNKIGYHDITDFSVTNNIAFNRSYCHDVNVVGQNNKVKSGAGSIFITGETNTIPANSTFISMIGNNNFQNQIIGTGLNTQSRIYTISEFNALPAPSTYTYYFVTGNGAINGKTLTPNSFGISAYCCIYPDGTRDVILPSEHGTNNSEFASSPISISKLFILGDNNSLGTLSSNNVIIGSNFNLPTAKVTNSILMGNSFNCNAFVWPEQTSATAGAIYHQYDNLKIFSGGAALSALGSGYSENAQTSEEIFMTHHYKNAMVFLPDNFAEAKPEMLGIFNNDKIKFVTDLCMSTSYLQDGVYTESPHSWLNGKTPQQIREMVNKPSTTMIYTGGIALLGNDSNSQYGLLKLGADVKPLSYIESNPLTGWEVSSEGCYNVVPIAGTTECPYAGSVLMVSGAQEFDGTMRIKLGNPALGKNVYKMVHTIAAAYVSQGTVGFFYDLSSKNLEDSAQNTSFRSGADDPTTFKKSLKPSINHQSESRIFEISEDVSVSDTDSLLYSINTQCIIDSGSDDETLAGTMLLHTPRDGDIIVIAGGEGFSISSDEGGPALDASSYENTTYGFTIAIDTPTAKDVGNEFMIYTEFSTNKAFKLAYDGFGVGGPTLVFPTKRTLNLCKWDNTYSSGSNYARYKARCCMAKLNGKTYYYWDIYPVLIF